MRALIIFTVIISCLLALPLIGICLQTSKVNIEEVYQKKDTRSWGEIFSWVFNRKQFEKSYALVIGIGDYQKDWPKLEAPYYDALRVRDFLVNDAGFDYVITLTNAKATKQKINDLMEETFPSLLHKDDKFLFYFSGHGTQRTIGEIPIGYLVLQNCGPESYGGMIAMEDIERWDRLLHPARHVLFILDSCFSGLAGQQRKSPLTDKKLERLSQYSHHLITSGTADEISVSHLSKWHGSLFTDSFLTAVSGRADLRSRDFDADGVVSLKELMKYVGDRIDQESVKLRSKNPLSKGIKMSPQMSELQDNAGEFFFITKHIKNKKVGNIGDEELKHGWPLEVETKGWTDIKMDRERLERERQELEKLKIEIERKKLEAKRKRLEAEKHQLEVAKLPLTPKVNEIARDGNFIAYSNGIVVDTSTGLTWAAKDNGRNVTWQEAKEYCESYRGGGYMDWRMPTRDELEGIYDKTKRNRYNYRVTKLIDIMSCCSWVSEIRGSRAAVFSFTRSGGRFWFDQSYSGGYRVIPVRYGN